MNLMGETLETEDIDRLVLGNTVCREILSDVLELVSENNEGK